MVILQNKLKQDQESKAAANQKPFQRSKNQSACNGKALQSCKSQTTDQTKARARAARKSNPERDKREDKVQTSRQHISERQQHSRTHPTTATTCYSMSTWFWKVYVCIQQEQAPMIGMSTPNPAQHPYQYVMLKCSSPHVGCLYLTTSSVTDCISFHDETACIAADTVSVND